MSYFNSLLSIKCIHTQYNLGGFIIKNEFSSVKNINNVCKMYYIHELHQVRNNYFRNSNPANAINITFSKSSVTPFLLRYFLHYSLRYSYWLSSDN